MKKYITQIKIRFLRTLGCPYGGNVVLVSRFSAVIYVTVIYARYRVTNRVTVAEGYIFLTQCKPCM